MMDSTHYAYRVRSSPTSILLRLIDDRRRGAANQVELEVDG
jgi:hypothetical protein